MQYGVQPNALIGHSLGEYVAACVAGVFSLEDALTLVVARGELMEDLPSGSMLSVMVSEEAVRPLLGAQLSLAAVNGSQHCVVSGPTPAITALERDLVDRGISTRRLLGSRAFHSRMMEPMMGRFHAVCSSIRPGRRRFPFISNLTGDWIKDAEASDPAYWVRHLREPVRFAAGLATLSTWADGKDVTYWKSAPEALSQV